MAKRSLINGIALFAFIMMVGLISCNKNDQLTPLESVVKDKTTPKIQAFKAKMKKGVKTADVYTVDSAVWYIEATLNFTYCLHTEDDPVVSDYLTDSLTIPVTVNDETISFEDVTAAYNTATAHTQEAFENIPNTVKDILFQDVEFKNGKLIVYTTFGVNQENNCKECDSPDIVYGNEHFVDNWYYGFGLGRCDGTCKGYDAAMLIKRKANLKIPRIYGYYTDIWESAEEWGVSFENPGGDPPYYVYYDASSCITAEHCEFYIDGAIIASNMKWNSTFPNDNSHELMSLNLRGVYGVPGGYTHAIKSKFGIPHPYGGGPSN